MSLGRLLVGVSLALAVAYVALLLLTMSDDPPEAVALEDLLHEHDGEPESFLQ